MTRFQFPIPAFALAAIAAIGCGVSSGEDESSLQQALKPSSSKVAVYQPMAVLSESFEKRWPGTDPSCFAVDDQYSWKAGGSLRPGESYTFEAIPTCGSAEMPVISVSARWDASDLEVTSVVPANDGVSDDYEQVGTPVSAAVRGREAHLCMFTMPASAAQGFAWSVTIRNKGSETAYDVSLEGEQHNGWSIYFHNQCSRADADRDGWNDALEHGMKMLTYYTNYPEPSLKWAAFDGTNYLRAMPESTTPNDEVDAWPPDVNDDGIVDQSDVDKVASYVGQGTGVSLDMIDANPGPNDQYKQAGVWRRYDLDGSGRVTEQDVALVEQLVGRSPMAQEDILSPTVELRSPAMGATVARGSEVLLEAFAFDNQWITQVDFYANDVLVCSATGGELTYAQRHQFNCWWKVPRKGGAVSLTARTRDSAGNAAESAKTTVYAQ